jgi:hydroxyacylglutathione hydrolase
MPLQIDHLICLRDNFVWLLREPQSGSVACVDPSEAHPVKAKLDQLGWKLTHILNTHHHNDHTGGNLELKRETSAVIVGPKADRDRIPGIDVALGENETYDFGRETARVFDIPGHTRGHIAFWFENAKAVLTGDTLFSLGCGRMFEGNPPMMWNSLSKLRKLPGDTRVYCGHEYTQSNAKFALTVDPDNAALKARATEVDALRAKGLPTLPSTMASECAANPFLRAADPVLARQVGLSPGDPVQVFAEVRARKDKF